MIRRELISVMNDPPIRVTAKKGEWVIDEEAVAHDERKEKNRMRKLIENGSAPAAPRPVIGRYG